MLGVLGILVERGDNLRPGDGFVIRVPAIVIGDHGDDAVAEFSFAGELGLCDIGHADHVEIHGAVHGGFGERGKLRTFHADVRTLAMDFNAAMNAGVGEDARDLRTGGLVKGDVGDKASTEECGDAIFCTIDELVGNEKFSGDKFFLQ